MELVIGYVLGIATWVIGEAIDNERRRQQCRYGVLRWCGRCGTHTDGDEQRCFDCLHTRNEEANIDVRC